MCCEFCNECFLNSITALILPDPWQQLMGIHNKYNEISVYGLRPSAVNIVKNALLV